jgi:NitT/TauT family transport system permease protein
LDHHVHLLHRHGAGDPLWALTIVLFAFALLVAELVGMLEKRIECYAGVRQ